MERLHVQFRDPYLTISRKHLALNKKPTFLCLNKKPTFLCWSNSISFLGTHYTLVSSYLLLKDSECALALTEYIVTNELAGERWTVVSSSSTPVIEIGSENLSTAYRYKRLCDTLYYDGSRQILWCVMFIDSCRWCDQFRDQNTWSTFPGSENSHDVWRVNNSKAKKLALLWIRLEKAM